jgi:SCY1-like protein 1
VSFFGCIFLPPWHTQLTAHTHRLKYVDSVETDTHVYIATERVRPLLEVLRDWDTGTYVSKGKGKDKAKDEWIAWGVKSLGVSLTHLCARRSGPS